MRTFIAVELPQEVKNKLAGLQELLKQSGADVKWIKPENIHLTLKFLGEIDEDKSAQVIRAIEDTARKSKQFRINLGSLGAFPKIELPRALWAGVDKGNKEITELAKELEEKIEKLGIPREERRFSSHITIGRVKSPLHKDKLAKVLKELEDYFSGKNIEFTAAKITLFKSTLGPGGPVYAALKEVKLTTT
ncbi:MAG: RNA 2',3'-cyclic phosphodiesterase [Candidatus Omnitrophica bacterium]|nr:RNA 2',3'-cyclic phosphodiesterase [Candidatus Omnitrophota bacterium]MDD5026867.1 RNA 2',3'-cyclic phosphodiesterase [Candidatus Omnitrophota bacterium]MDD5661992.1 RNA 2',3'-cyclic phosphodiesterase [Candidatus Omnitrophota bacterium]